MDDRQSVSVPRHETHGDDNTMGSQPNDRTSLATTSVLGSMGAVHCHECWKYTDDMNRHANLVHEAVTLLAQGGTLSVEKSKAFEAADEFLAQAFKPSLSVPRF